MSDAPTEYRVCWNASSNITFEGESDWFSLADEHGDDHAEDLPDADAVLRYYQDNDREGPLNMPRGLEMFLDASGVDWWVEVR